MAGSNFPFDDGNVITAAGQNQAGRFAGALGEVKMFALSETGAVTKANLQAAGWAICDGTTPTAQGISSADITSATPNLENKFIMGSDNETSGTTGGANQTDLSHDHTLTSTKQIDSITTGSGDYIQDTSTTTTNSQLSATYDNRPAFYELVFFMKVKEAL